MSILLILVVAALILTVLHLTKRVQFDCLGFAVLLICIAMLLPAFGIVVVR